MDIIKGRVYRAKNPANLGGLFNDRQVLYVGLEFVQYDGPAVVNGRKYPKVTHEAFAKWAGRDVTDELPPGEWAKFQN
jgi:hypothetical protein